MSAEPLTARRVDDAVFDLEPVDLSKIPARHPVAVFAKRYHDMTDGKFIPDENKLLEDRAVRQIASWLEHIEPVELGGHVDFYVLEPGGTPPRGGTGYDDENWMGNRMEEGFADARYHECVSASILRTPRFSRGAVPIMARSFVKQYRGVFPMFAENHARLRLAIMAAETFIELKE